jgi:hypothetical protein
LLIQLRRSPVTNPSAFAANILAEAWRMSRRRKPFYRPTPEYNAYLAGWAFAFSVVLVTLMLIAHGVHF